MTTPITFKDFLDSLTEDGRSKMFAEIRDGSSVDIEFNDIYGVERPIEDSIPLKECMAIDGSPGGYPELLAEIKSKLKGTEDEPEIDNT